MQLLESLFQFQIDTAFLKPNISNHLCDSSRSFYLTKLKIMNHPCLYFLFAVLSISTMTREASNSQTHQRTRWTKKNSPQFIYTRNTIRRVPHNRPNRLSEFKNISGHMIAHRPGQLIVMTDRVPREQTLTLVKLRWGIVSGKPYPNYSNTSRLIHPQLVRQTSCFDEQKLNLSTSKIASARPILTVLF